MWKIALGVLLCGSLAAGHGGHAHGTPAAASFAAADGGVASSWALTLVSAAAFGVFALSLYSKADGAEARPLLVKAT